MTNANNVVLTIPHTNHHNLLPFILTFIPPFINSNLITTKTLLLISWPPLYYDIHVTPLADTTCSCSLSSRAWNVFILSSSCWTSTRARVVAKASSLESCFTWEKCITSVQNNNSCVFLINRLNKRDLYAASCELVLGLLD